MLTIWSLSAAWALALLAALAAPVLISASAVYCHVHLTIYIALTYYAIAAAILLTTSRDQWHHAGATTLARLCWTLGWLTYLIHVLMAFHHVDQWSHGNALRRTEIEAGFGEGLFFSH